MIIKASSVFPANREIVFNKLQEIKTLQFICAPMATFSPIDKCAVIWKSGKSFQFKLRVMGIKFGIHSINVDKFNINKISTHEHNKIVPIWNHIILLKECNNGKTLYTDIVEVHAGIKTFFIWMWANIFYRHRQKRWRKLLKSKHK